MICRFGGHDNSNLRDGELDLPVLACLDGHELCWNDVPLQTKVIECVESRGEHLAVMSASVDSGGASRTASATLCDRE